jgi:casein kinase I family protein HRR25
MNGQLPWQSMKGQGKKEKYDKIMEKKLTIELTQLCHDLPVEFQ